MENRITRSELINVTKEKTSLFSASYGSISEGISNLKNAMETNPVESLAVLILSASTMYGAGREKLDQSLLEGEGTCTKVGGSESTSRISLQQAKANLLSAIEGTL